MAQDKAQQFLQQGIAAAKAGQKDQARQILQQAVRLSPQNETIWLWLSSVAKDDKERVFCLKQILEINPNNELAQKGLKALGIEPTQAAQPQAGVPILTPEKFAAMQAEMDEFLRGYSPLPRTILDVEWVHKKKKRFAEGAAARLQRTTYAIVAGVIGMVLLGAILLILSLDLSVPFVNPEVVVRATLTPSQTPTLTPTATPGVANTDTPEPDETRTPIAIAQGLPRGDVFRSSPTPEYPPYEPAIQGPIRTAVFFYAIGNDEGVQEISGNIRTQQSNSCYGYSYYFEALILAQDGEYEDAVDLLESAIGREIGRGDTCQTGNGRAIVDTGLCRVKYLEAIADPSQVDIELLTEASTYCESALEINDLIADASNTLARIYIQLGRSTGDTDYFSLAERTVGGALQDYPASVDLFLTRAEIEMATSNPNDALVYILSALAIDPGSEEGLRKRAEAHLMLAQASTGEERILRYGEAAINAEAYLLLYPGQPIAHVLLATARYEEGNPDRALQSLNRVLQVEDTLPPTARNAIIQAHALRARIHLERQDWNEALEDLQSLQELDPNNLSWLEQQTEIAFQLNDYTLALEKLTESLELFPGQVDLLVSQARLLSLLCQYNRDIECDFEKVNDTLTDELVNTLSGTLRGNALLYQAEAHFALLNERTVSPEIRNEELAAILENVNESIVLHQTPHAYYLQGRIYEELEQPAEALRAYEWIAYWTQFYEYPFGEDVQSALPRLRRAIQDAATTATPTS